MHKPKKKFGQHFLNDNDILDKIVSHAQLQENDTVWEIGPGLGSLTDALLKHNIDLTIFEIDNDLIPILTKKYANKCKIVHCDILKIEPENYATNRIKIVTNLPFQISSPFLYKVAENYSLFDKIIVMLQKEVAKRVSAKPGSKDYGVLSIKSQFYFDVEYLFEVSPDKFNPPPDVYSAVIKLSPRKNIPNIENITMFWHMVESAFKMKRKTLKNNFLASNICINSDNNMNFDFNRRAETISEEEFIQLFNVFEF